MQRAEREEDPYRKAELAAAGMLSRRPLSAKLLEQRLIDKGYEPEAAAYAVERMRLLKAIDDHAYAELLLQAYARKGYGVLRIRQEMYHRGVPNGIAAEVLEDFTPDLALMKALLHKKLRGDASDQREKEKAMAALQRRGFTFSQIRAAMEDYLFDLSQESIED